MTKKKIWTIIIGSGIVASVTTAATFFPEQRIFLIPAAALVTAIVSYLTGSEKP